MKNKVYSAVIFLLLATPVLVVAADGNTEMHGTIELGVLGGHINGNEARFQEYRDMEDGVVGGVQIDVLKGTYYLQMDAENPNADDQSFQLKGGAYDNFKYKFYYDEIVHNYGFDAITPYSGLGTNHAILSGDITYVNPDISTWTHFDSKVNHKSYGGELEISLHSPYFVNIGAERREQTGLRPYTSHRPEDTEVPEPISTTTDNFHVKAGYRGESLTTSVSGYLSSFNNDINYMSTDTPAVDSNPDDNYNIHSQDNDYRRLAADLTLRNLPMGSVLSAGASFSNLNTSYTASDIGLNALNLNNEWDTLNSRIFDGDIDHTSCSLALSSKPWHNLTTRIYYNYLERDNNSSAIYYGSGDNRTELLSYKKNMAGIDIGYRLPYKTKLAAGYEYLNMHRSTPSGEGHPTNSTTDNSLYVQFKNSGLDWLATKVRYKYASRDSDALEAPTPFYYQDQSSNEWKLSFELYPVDRFDLGLDFAYKDIDYDYAVDTRTNDTRKSVYLDAVWHIYGKAALSGFIGFETVETDANRVTDDDPAPIYAQTVDDKFWTYGLAVNIPDLVDNLTFNISWQYQKSDGAIIYDNSLTGTAFENIAEADDYTKKKLEAKAIYALTSSWNLTLGYIYEKYEYNDIYTANFPATYSWDEQFYSGMFAFTDYEANIGYLMLKYSF